MWRRDLDDERYLECPHADGPEWVLGQRGAAVDYHATEVIDDHVDIDERRSVGEPVARVERIFRLDGWHVKRDGRLPGADWWDRRGHRQHGLERAYLRRNEPDWRRERRRRYERRRYDRHRHRHRNQHQLLGLEQRRRGAWLRLLSAEPRRLLIVVLGRPT